MTYKTRQEVFEAAAKWLRVCESAGVEARCKLRGFVRSLHELKFNDSPKDYEFPLTLLEGKEVWIGSELYGYEGNKFIAEEFIDGYFCEAGYSARGYGFSKLADNCSWNSPKPKTVMVYLDTQHAEELLDSLRVGGRLYNAIKKALENLK